MGCQFRVLGSSSAGNCALLDTGRTKILIEAGFSARRIQKLLKAAGESIEAIDGVFLTHEHKDHAAGLTGLARFQHLRFFANRATAQAIQARLNWRPQWQVFETGARFQYRDLEVHAFSVPHDAYDPVGFTFAWGEGDLFSPRQSLAWVTDLGYISQLVRERIRAVNILVIEANYDGDLLDSDPRRPWAVKQRIRGRHGHLSNQAAHELLAGIEQPYWQHVFLVHLSRDCNEVDRVRTLFGSLIERGRTFTVNVIDPTGDGLSPAITL
ncbi:MAG: MBL fold metallo-hydrolase [Opitutales bacterium]